MTNDTYQAFKKWLVASGATIVPAMRTCEALRFTHGKAKGVIVVDKKGIPKPSETASRYLDLFQNAAPLPTADTPTSKSVRKREARIKALMNRDGSNCFYCGDGLGSDRTIEHLVPRSHKGPEHLSNLCLAHKNCNLRARDLPVVGKVRLREKRHLKPQVCQA